VKKISSFKGYSSVPGSANTDTVNMYIKRQADGYYYDFNDNTFKNSGWTNKFSTLVADSDFHQKWLLSATIDLTGWDDGSYIFTIADTTLEITYNDSYYIEDYDLDSVAAEIIAVDANLVLINSELVSVDDDLTAIDANLTAIDANLTTIDADLVTINAELVTIDSDMAAFSVMLTRAMGLTQENHYMDQMVYSGDKLSSARMRLYSNAGSVGTDSDVIATYTITATYSENDLQTYKVVKL